MRESLRGDGSWSAQTLGRAVARHRQIVRWSRESLAERLGIPVEAIAAIEGGEGVVGAMTLYGLARTLGCRMEDLLEQPRLGVRLIAFERLAELVAELAARVDLPPVDRERRAWEVQFMTPAEAAQRWREIETSSLRTVWQARAEQICARCLLPGRVRDRVYEILSCWAEEGGPPVRPWDQPRRQR